MTIDEFRKSLSSEKPPGGIAPAVIALWHDARGDWDEAHRVAQDVPDGQGGAWVHAYLHRKEGALVFTSYETGRRYRVTVLAGDLHREGDEALGRAGRAVVAGADGRPWEIVVEETTAGAPPYAPDRPTALYSLSKTFTASAVGLAVGEGLVRLDDLVADLLPDAVPADGLSDDERAELVAGLRAL